MVYLAEVEAAKDTSKRATAAQARIYEGQFVVEGRDMVLGMVRRDLNTSKFNIDQPLFGHTCIHLDPEERHDRFLIDRELLDE